MKIFNKKRPGILFACALLLTVASLPLLGVGAIRPLMMAGKKLFGGGGGKVGGPQAHANVNIGGQAGNIGAGPFAHQPFAHQYGAQQYGAQPFVGYGRQPLAGFAPQAGPPLYGPQQAAGPPVFGPQPQRFAQQAGHDFQPFAMPVPDRQPGVWQQPGFDQRIQPVAQHQWVDPLVADGQPASFNRQQPGFDQRLQPVPFHRQQLMPWGQQPGYYGFGPDSIRVTQGGVRVDARSKSKGGKGRAFGLIALAGGGAYLFSKEREDDEEEEAQDRPQEEPQGGVVVAQGSGTMVVQEPRAERYYYIMEQPQQQQDNIDIFVRSQAQANQATWPGQSALTWTPQY